MGTPIMSHEEMRQLLVWALNSSHPDDLARHVMAIAQVLPAGYGRRAGRSGPERHG